MADLLACSICNTTVVVIQTPAAAVSLTCCDQVLQAARPAPCSAPQPRSGGQGTLAGSWYTDEPSGLIVRCTRGGRGTVSCDGKAMTQLPDRHFSARSVADLRGLRPADACI
jgi:hypothetical protein